MARLPPWSSGYPTGRLLCLLENQPRQRHRGLQQPHGDVWRGAIALRPLGRRSLLRISAVRAWCARHDKKKEKNSACQENGKTKKECSGKKLN